MRIDHAAVDPPKIPLKSQQVAQEDVIVECLRFSRNLCSVSWRQTGGLDGASPISKMISHRAKGNRGVVFPVSLLEALLPKPSGKYLHFFDDLSLGYGYG